MKKKILLIIFVAVISLIISSCNKQKLTDFESLVSYIYSSEEKLASYDETSIIKDGDMEIYNKNTDFKLIRGEKTISEVNIVEKKLSVSGNTMYDEQVTNYKTIDDIKYTIVDGNTYENSYTMPTYYLTFVLSEDFLEEGYSLTKDDSNYKLNAHVLDNKISSLFLNKSLGNIYDMDIEIVVENELLKSFTAKYKSTTGFDAEISTVYSYGVKGSARAVFHLEGGSCKNSYSKISYVYNFNGSIIDTLIYDPNEIEENENDKVKLSGYHIEGWYKTKITNVDGSVTYADKWDFSKDRMTIDGVELYAKWEENRTYKYELYYKDALTGEDVYLDGVVVKEGSKFDDILLRNKTVKGYTSLGYLDEEGQPWNPNFTHPGGDEDLTVKVYLDLIEGEYTVVRTARQFKNAISRGQNVYLMNDIDFDGDELVFTSYSGLIEGNGKTISNFVIDYNDQKSGLKGELDNPSSPANYLYVSLFYELKDATIQNINFKDVSVDIETRNPQIKNIVFAALCIKAENTTINNVSFTGEFKITQAPECEKEIILDKFYYKNYENVIVDSESSVKFTDESN